MEVEIWARIRQNSGGSLALGRVHRWGTMQAMLERTEEMDQDQISTLTQEECHEDLFTEDIMSSWSRFSEDSEDILREPD